MRTSSILFFILTLAVSTLIFGAVESSGQVSLRPLKQQRKQVRAQKQLEQQDKNKPATTGETSTQAPEAAKHSLDGISEAGPREFPLRFFSKDEREMVIPGFGREAAFLIVMRQLDLTQEQVRSIKLIRKRVGRQLVLLRQQHILLENQLEDALYGETFDPKQVEALSVQAGQKQAEITRMQASIESELRQILTPDQFYVFRFLVGEMLLPQRRPQLLRQQQQRRMGPPPAAQPRPNP